MGPNRVPQQALRMETSPPHFGDPHVTGRRGNRGEEPSFSAADLAAPLAILGLPP